MSSRLKNRIPRNARTRRPPETGSQPSTGRGPRTNRPRTARNSTNMRRGNNCRASRNLRRVFSRRTSTHLDPQTTCLQETVRASQTSGDTKLTQDKVPRRSSPPRLAPCSRSQAHARTLERRGSRRQDDTRLGRTVSACIARAGGEGVACAPMELRRQKATWKARHPPLTAAERALN